MQPSDASSLIARYLPELRLTKSPSLALRAYLCLIRRRPPTGEMVSMLRQLVAESESSEPRSVDVVPLTGAPLLPTNATEALALFSNLSRAPVGERAMVEAWYGIKP